MDNSSVREAGAASTHAPQGVLIASAVAAGLFLLNVWPKTGTPAPEPHPSEAVLAHQNEERLAYENARTIALDLPGVDCPPAHSPSEAKLADDEAIIGVSGGGRSRAYQVRALAQGPASHIVNDVLGGVPISVTYCDLRDCVRVFTGKGRGTLALRQGGLHRGEMVLRSAGHPYRQESLSALEPDGTPDFPYKDYAYERTTWGTWRKAHPSTDIYLGSPDTHPSGS